MHIIIPNGESLKGSPSSSVLCCVIDLDLSSVGSADDFHYTNQGRNPVIDGVDDAKEMSSTRHAFTLLGKVVHQICCSVSSGCIAEVLC